DRAGLDDEPKLRAVFGLRVRADVVVQPVGQLAARDLLIDRYRLGERDRLDRRGRLLRPDQARGDDERGRQQQHLALADDHGCSLSSARSIGRSWPKNGVRRRASMGLLHRRRLGGYELADALAPQHLAFAIFLKPGFVTVACGHIALQTGPRHCGGAFKHTSIADARRLMRDRDRFPSGAGFPHVNLAGTVAVWTLGARVRELALRLERLV